LSEIQVETLNLFSKRGFTLSINEFDIFVKSRGVFKNSLLDSINEIYFDLLDDVLIEEDEEAITLTETYYSKIIN
jgi:predicted ATP-binding protein involved in virulence